MKYLALTLLVAVASLTAGFSAHAGGSSTVGALGPTGLIMKAFDVDSEIQTEVRKLESEGYKAIQKWPVVELIERTNCRVPEGDQYVGGKATFTICDSTYSAERDFKRPGKGKVVKVRRIAKLQGRSVQFSKE